MLNGQYFISELKLEQDNNIWCLWAAAEVIQLQYKTAGIITGWADRAYKASLCFCLVGVMMQDLQLVKSD